jgi:hypothetical protein
MLKAIRGLNSLGNFLRKLDELCQGDTTVTIGFSEVAKAAGMSMHVMPIKRR